MFSLENELEKRLSIIRERDAKIEKMAELKIEYERLEAEVASENVDELNAEIEEIKALMPKPVVEEEVACEDVVAEEVTPAE